MEYKINKKRILEVLKPYDESLFFDKNDSLCSEYDNNFIFTFHDLRIMDIKNNTFKSSSEMIRRLIIDKLNQHFDECFEEIKPKYSYKKCKKFLEDLGFKIDEEGYISYEVTDTSNGVNEIPDTIDDIIGFLNEEGREVSTNKGDIIYTMLKNNKEQLLEE